MIPTLDNVLAGYRAELGTSEKPAGSNRVRYSRAYRLIGPWCHMFISVVARERGAGAIIPWAAYTPAGAAWFKNRKAYGKTPKRGAIVYYRFPGFGRISHVGIVEAVHRDGTITAIEGNTDAYGGRTGGKVMRRRRSLNLVDGFGYPAYVSPAAAARAVRRKKAAKKATRRGGAAVVVIITVGSGAVLLSGPPVTPSPRPTVTVTATPRPAVRPTAQPKPRPVVKGPLFKRELAVRRPPYQSGRDVGLVQRDLLGFKGSEVDREFGPDTSRALKGWQKRHGLPATGRFTRATARKAGWRVP